MPGPGHCQSFGPEYRMTAVHMSVELGHYPSQLTDVGYREVPASTRTPWMGAERPLAPASADIR